MSDVTDRTHAAGADQGAAGADQPTAGATQAGPKEDWRGGIRASGSKQLIVLLVTALLVAGGAWLLGGKAGSAKSAPMNGAQAVQVTGDTSGPAPEVGKPAQDFTARTVKGEPISLSELKGRPVWLTFGASWCTACRAEAPDMQAAYTAAKASGVEIVSVNMQELPADVVSYAGKLGLTFPQVADPDTALASKYRVMGLPSHFFIDKEGVLRSQHIGVLTRSAMDQQIGTLAR